MAQQLAKLKSKVKSLEEQLFQRNEELQRYQTMGSAADEKIQALGRIHNDKIRSLMNSIQMLKKENAQLQNQGKEHKRSKLISQLNRQIEDQDTVIEVLRNYVYKKEGKEVGRATCDSIIVAALTKGPERIRALSREELRMEIDRLKNEVLLLRKKMKDPTTAAQQANQQQPTSQVLGESAITEQSSFENANEQLLKNLQQLKAENETLRLEIKSGRKVVESLTADLKKHNRLQVQLVTTRSDLQVAQRKVETLEALLKQIKESSNSKIIQLYEREIKVEELELQSKQTTNKLNLLQQNHGLRLEELTLEKQKIAAELEALTKENERLIMEGIANKKRQEQQRTKINEIRDLNTKQKDELTAKLEKYQLEIARILRQSDQRAQRIVLLQAKLKQELERFAQEKMELQAGLDDLTKAGVTKEEMGRLKQKEAQLEEEIRKFKEVVEAGTVKDSSTGTDILQMRIKAYEEKLAALEGLLKRQGKLTDHDLKLMGDGGWYEKFLQLAKQFEKYKLENKTPTPGDARRTARPAEIVEVDQEQLNQLENMSSGVSNMGLNSVDGRILNNYDSDFEYSLHKVETRRKGVPVPTDNDRQLMKLINSDLWDFIREDRLGMKIEEFADEYDSNYEGMPEEDDAEWNREIKELQDLQSRMRRGMKVDLYKSQASKVMEMSQSVSEVSAKDLKGYDSDVNLNMMEFESSKIQDHKQKPLAIRAQDFSRIQDISSELPSSVEAQDVSQPVSGESRINMVARRKVSKDKGKFVSKVGSRLPATLEGKDSDYEGVMQTKLKMGEMNSDVSVNSSLRQNDLKLIDSDVSANFKRRK